MNQTARLICSQVFLTFVFIAPIFAIASRNLFYSRFIQIAEVKNYSLDDQRDIYSTFDAEDQIEQGLPIDPFDLMNRLKQAGAMNNATTPSDALDEALNAFDQSQYENIPIE